MSETTTAQVTSTPAPRKKSNTLLIVVLVILGVLALCGIFGAKLAGTAFKGLLNSKGVNFDPNNENLTIKTEDGTLTFNDDSGTGSITTDQGEIKYGENLTIPSDFPSNIPVIPGAKIVTVSTKTEDGTAFVSFTSEKSAEEVMAYYKDELKNKGWIFGSEYSGAMLGFSNATHEIGVIVSKGDNGLTSVVISTTSKN